jgi:hypothetical protein
MLKSLPQTVIAVLTNYYSAVWLSCCNGDNRPLIARLSSVNIIDNETICCCIPAKFAGELLSVLVKNNAVAVLAACTETFDSYQVKGFIESVYNLPAEEIAEQKNMLELFSTSLTRLGLSAPYFFNAYVDDEFVAVVVKVKDIFNQTPRQGTGFKINE